MAGRLRDEPPAAGRRFEVVERAGMSPTVIACVVPVWQAGVRVCTTALASQGMQTLPLPGPAPRSLPYGSWPTPITSELVVRAAARLGEVAVTTDGVWWAERAGRRGRADRALVHRAADGTTTDLLPDPWNARTRVHEYGGGSWTVDGGTATSPTSPTSGCTGWSPARDPEPLTAAPEIPAGVRFADLTVTPGGQVLCVRETHTASGAAAEVVHEVVAVAPDGTVAVLVSGPDFVSDPRTGPDGALSWLQWQHPDMPWDAAQLVVRAADGTETVVAGGRSGCGRSPSSSRPGPPTAPCCSSPTAPASGRCTGGGPAGSPSCCWTPGGDMAGPHWVLGASRYAELPDGRLVVAYGRDGADRLAVLEPGGPRELPTRYASFGQLRADGAAVVCVAGGPT